MSIIEFILRAETAPFSFALAMLMGLLALEIVSALAGFSLMGGGEADADVDMDLDIDVDPGAGLEVDSDLGEAAADAVDTPAAVGGLAGALAWLGVGRVPMMVWIAGVLAGFGIAGYVLQTLSANLFGGLLPALVAAPIAFVPGLFFGAQFARLIARIVPKVETSALSRRHFGGHVGVIAQGTSARGRPAQARFRDRHGEFHYVPVEPMNDGETIERGAEVVILRARRGDAGANYRVIRLDDARSEVTRKGALK